MGLTEKDWHNFNGILSKATRSELDKMEDELQKEIRLSETAINECMEKRV